MVEQVGAGDMSKKCYRLVVVVLFLLMVSFSILTDRVIYFYK